MRERSIFFRLLLHEQSCKKYATKGVMSFCLSTNQDPADIWGMIDFHVENVHFLFLLDFRFPDSHGVADMALNREGKRRCITGEPLSQATLTEFLSEL